jgi:RNA polymerase sigma-70 factor (ECF subfamily)
VEWRDGSWLDDGLSGFNGAGPPVLQQKMKIRGEQYPAPREPATHSFAHSFTILVLAAGLGAQGKVAVWNGLRADRLLASPGMQPARTSKSDRMLATRLSLIERLVDWKDQARWQEFFDTYWRLIYNVARKSGLTDAEAQDVVQDTVITIAKSIGKYDRQAGSFKGWLLNTTRWRIADQFRKRQPAEMQSLPHDDDGRDTATIDRIAGADGREIESVWDQEWERNLFDAALERVKKRVSARQFQIFECCVVKHWAAARVAETLRVNVAQVYLAKHRVSALMKKEVAALAKQA